MSTKDLFENYTAYTDALEMSHSAAADDTARSTWPTFPAPPTSTFPTFPTFPQFPF